MAQFIRRGSTWTARVRRRGVAETSTFATKSAAQIWAQRIEASILSGEFQRVPDLPVADLLTRYAAEVSPTHRGAKWEVNRLNLLGRDALATVRLPALNQGHIAQWRDRRLTQVTSSSVNREWNLLSGVFTVALREWRVLTDHPMRGVKRPAAGKARDRLPTEAEIEALRFVMGDQGGTIVSTVFLAWLFAIETGMRLGEIVRLSEVSGRVATLRDTKNGDARQVPLSPAAVRIWRDHGPFAVTAAQIDIHFRKSVVKAGIADLHFHDSRAAAITRLSKKLDILALARAIGHRNLSQLQTYYRESADELAAKLG